MILPFQTVPKTLTEEQERERKALQIVNAIREQCRPAVVKIQKRQARRRFWARLLFWRRG